MSIHLYLDSDLNSQVSENGDMGNPDSDTYNGTDGESKDRELYLANEQTELNDNLDDSQTLVKVDDDRFENNEVIIIDSEQMKILSGGGTANLIVQRGYNGTTPESHSTGAKVYSAYNYTNLVIQPIDVDSTSDETAWFRLATTQPDLDSASPGGSLNVGNKNYDQTKSVWRRVTVPASTPVQNKTDLRLRIVGVENPVTS